MKTPLFFPFRYDLAIEFVSLTLARHGRQRRIDEIAVLAYLCDRVAIARMNRPIIGGHYVATLDGPMISEVYDMLDADTIEFRVPYADLERPFAKQDLSVKLLCDPDRQDLSEEQFAVVTDVGDSFANMAKHELENWCAENCPEYGDLTVSEFTLIRLDRVVAILGKTNREIAEITRKANELSPLPFLV